MRIAYENAIDSATAPTALTADLQYPITNVQNQRLAKPWRSTSISAQTVVINFGTATSINTAAVMGHNLTAGATIGLMGNPTDSWGSPSVSTTITTIVGGMCLNYFTASSQQYWRFSLDNATGGTSYISIGRLWLGTYLTIDPSSLIDFSVTKNRSDTVAYGRGRQKYATEGVGWRSFRLSFPRTSNTMLESIQTMYDAVGNHGSMLFCNFDSLRTYPLVEPCYVSIVGEIAFRHTRFMKFEYGLTLTEDR